MHDTGRSGLVHWDDPEGWDGKEAPKGGDTCARTAGSFRGKVETNTTL